MINALLRHRSPRPAIAAERRAAFVERTCAAVERARTCYFKEARCLQSAVVTSWLLRWRGVAATCVIGVRRVPFIAHAWVEVDGTVILNDQENLSTVYSVIEKI